MTHDGREVRDVPDPPLVGGEGGSVGRLGGQGRARPPYRGGDDGCDH